MNIKGFVMKRQLFYLSGIVFFFFLFFLNQVKGQESDCKVSLPGLSGTYIGKCKNGLAHGKGVAKGIDSYEGQFRKGLPNGKGTYTWANGSFYKGQWSKGLKNGSGEMVFNTSSGDSILKGYWDLDKYIGEKLIPPYKISRNIGVVHYRFYKVNDAYNNVVFNVGSGVSNFSVIYSSGNEYVSGTIHGLQDVKFPLELKITYMVWNKIHTTQNSMLFEFVINDPGNWEITMRN
jgi:hypothetical protein